MIAEEKKIWKIREQLEDLTEENYKQFNEKLLPGVKHIIGVRLPALRKIAKETAKSNYSEYLNEAGTMLGEASYHEEFMVWGLVIAYIKAEVKWKGIWMSLFLKSITGQCATAV